MNKSSSKSDSDELRVKSDTKDGNGVFLFYGTKDFCSQFHPAKFTIEDFEYSCCEQYMMHQKAVEFKDYEMIKCILNETKPKKMKAFGRKVKNFDEDVWTKKCRDVVFKCNLEKFSQNEHLKKQLLDTGNKIIAEASPFDKRWGIGLSKKNAKAQNPTEWKGKNWLGEAIIKVREELRKEKIEDEEQEKIEEKKKEDAV